MHPHHSGSVLPAAHRAVLFEASDPSDFLRPRYPAAAWEMFAEGMSAGLVVYRVRVEYTVPFADGPLTSHAPRPDLFSAMCLQLFNMMTEDLPVHRCANETCGRRFVRQLGRAESGQYRTAGRALLLEIMRQGTDATRIPTEAGKPGTSQGQAE